LDELYQVYLQIHDAREKLAEIVRHYDVGGYLHEKQQEEGGSPESEETPSPDPTISSPLSPPPEPQGEVEPRRIRKKLSSAQKRTLREKGEIP